MHIMLDLETWGKKPGCDIRSIGAVVFDPITGFVAGANAPALPDNQFYIATENPTKQIIGYDDGTGTRRKCPLTRDPETVQWWNDQSDEAKAAFADPVDLREACGRFAEWFVDFDNGNYGRDGKIYLWANDPHFDVSILQAVFDGVGLDEPWHYRAPRSMKTVCDLAGITRDDMKAFEYGTYHNALDDAISQAMIVCEAYKRLGLQR